MNLHIFWKNVNKQLKSADFFSEMSKFQKSLLTQILTFFIVMSKHTLILVVHQPNMKYLVFLIHFLLSVLIFKRKILDWIFQLILHLWIQIWIMAIGIWIWPNNKTVKLDYPPKPKKSKNFCCDTDWNLIVAGHRYNLYKFTL